MERDAVIPLPTVDTIYEVPLILEEEGLGKLVVDKLGLKIRPGSLSPWQELATRIKEPLEPVNIALV